MNRTHSGQTLSWFLTLSIALHVSVVLIANHDSSVLTTRQLGEDRLDVELQSDRHPARPGQSTTTGSPLSSADFDNPGAQKSAGIVANPSTPATGSDNGSRTPEPSGVVSSGMRNQLLGELRTRLSDYLTYPPLARRRGWEGTVLLGLRVESDGRLDKIHIEHGSGYPVLDHSALNSLNRVRRLAEAADWLEGRSIDLQLPVVYRLIEN